MWTFFSLGFTSQATETVQAALTSKCLLKNRLHTHSVSLYCVQNGKVTKKLYSKQSVCGLKTLKLC